MKQKLSEWGIQSPHLINATGLNTQTISGDPDGKGDENQLSAYDIAVIAKHLLQDFPEVTKYTSKPTALFSNTQIENPNLMLEGMPNYRSGVDGLRVSNSTKGGITFAASTTQNGIHMITVVLGVEAVDGDPYARFVATSSLMNYVVRTFVSSIVVKEGDPYGKSKATVMDGKSETVLAVAKKTSISLKSKAVKRNQKFNSRVTKNHSEHLSNQAQILENYTTLIQIKSDVAT